MNRTTGAQRTNARYDKIWAQYEAQKEEIEMTHTPGPWKVIADGRGYAHIVSEREAVDPVTEARHLFIAAVQHLPEEIATRATDADETEANARLIAAAPALLEALEALSEAVKPTREGKRDGGTFGSLSLADDEARDVIARAKGQRVG